MTELSAVDRARSYRKIYIFMLISSLASLGASLVLSVDAIAIAKNAATKLSCDVNAIVSCGKVARSWQSTLLGFPNSFIGLICEPVVVSIAVAGLGLVMFPKWFLKAALIVYGFGLAFAFWLLSQSFFVIKAFCPWCLVVTISTVTVFSTMLRINLRENTLNISQERQAKVINFLDKGWDHVIVAGVYSIILIAIFFKYGKYFLPTIGA
jgi:uncharacterized membrane protein